MSPHGSVTYVLYRSYGHAGVDRVSLVVMKHEFSSTPISVAGWLDQIYTCGAKSLTERVNIIDAQIQVQMPTFVHKCNRWVLCIYKL